MSDIIALLPPDIAPWMGLLLIAAAVVTSSVSASTGIGGGAMMLAILAMVLPPAALIPVHGILQLGSNSSRCYFMRAHLDLPTIAAFALGSVGGVVVGGILTFQVPQEVMLGGLALFILWSVWGRMPEKIHDAGMLAGGIASGVLTMFVGATGPFVAAFLRPVLPERRAFVAAHAACMTVQHTAKLVVFGALGFAYGPYLALTLAMVGGGFVGSWLGRGILDLIGEALFQHLLKALLTLAALRLLWQAAS